MVCGMCFGINILSLFHLATLITLIQNENGASVTFPDFSSLCLKLKIGTNTPKNKGVLLKDPFHINSVSCFSMGRPGRVLYLQMALDWTLVRPGAGQP